MNDLSFRRIACWIIATFVTLISSQVSGHEEQEITIGRTATDQLKVEIDFTQPIELEPSVFPGISGYATGLLGIHSAIFDDPGNDFFQLSTSADLRFILVAKDPGMEVWNDTGSAYMGIGESFYIGPAPFDTHPIWNLVTGTTGNTYSLTLKLHDVNGVYPDSDPFVLGFRPILIPQLNIVQTDPQHVTLSWTTNALDWTVETITSLGTTNWTTVTNAVGITGGEYSLMIDTADIPQQFFRLRKD